MVFIEGCKYYLISCDSYCYFVAKVWAYYSRCQVCIRAIEYNDYDFIYTKTKFLDIYISKVLKKFSVSLKENIIIQDTRGQYMCFTRKECNLILKHLRSICHKYIIYG